MMMVLGLFIGCRGGRQQFGGEVNGMGGGVCGFSFSFSSDVGIFDYWGKESLHLDNCKNHIYK